MSFKTSLVPLPKDISHSCVFDFPDRGSRPGPPPPSWVSPYPYDPVDDWNPNDPNDNPAPAPTLPTGTRQIVFGGNIPNYGTPSAQVLRFYTPILTGGLLNFLPGYPNILGWSASLTAPWNVNTDMLKALGTYALPTSGLGGGGFYFGPLFTGGPNKFAVFVASAVMNVNYPLNISNFCVGTDEHVAVTNNYATFDNAGTFGPVVGVYLDNGAHVAADALDGVTYHMSLISWSSVDAIANLKIV